MKKIFIFLLCFSHIAKANDFSTLFTELVAQHLPNAAVGLIIQGSESGQIVFESRANENFYPASNTKLFTAIAALKLLGPAFQFKTTLNFTPENLKQGTLNDSLYLIFQGDPSLNNRDIFVLLETLRSQSLRHIQGDIVIDDSAFDTLAYAPGWTWDSIPWYYSAPVKAIILNENKVRLKINKAKKLGERLDIQQIDNFPVFEMQKNVIAVSTPEAKLCPLQVQTRQNVFKLSGCWPTDKTPAHIELALDDPRQLIKTLLHQYLKKLEISFSGQIRFGHAPPKVPAIATQLSPPLKVLLTKVLADSNNLYTECLTKALGLAYFNQGTFQAGVKAIKAILSQKLALDTLHLKDGSGQSRYNLASPALISQLLYHMYHDPLFPVFYATLSVAGKSGKLAPRLNNKNVAGKIVAKTGSASGTSALSGYFTAESGRTYLFSLLINQSTHDFYQLKAFEDALCEQLVTEPWGT